ncbi:delta 1-pyrroline-5-carboxylate reductase [Aspergillus chevalieri]|uniref:Delta 1-pyrroline-5-carboxylate reductase n=1 Tax=Aspergillus chevalieri TaxID=182096 RepID=A0A7R7ZP49_ASPCH|nr:delta 1-pyrroline-5-carboxylate reductase [Aspergillus chevalieri]BCR88324.1 delta 1-pyrroline-5-carboxylate reductase [Aspergillus chevalieri]
MGVPRAEAQIMAAQVMRGMSPMVLDGGHPSLLKEQICTPGGRTAGGLLVLEENGVRGSIARSVREAAVIASQLGQGIKNVNGTRH